VIIDQSLVEVAAFDYDDLVATGADVLWISSPAGALQQYSPAEIAAVEDGRADPENNVLKQAPHNHHLLVADDWNRPYAKEQAFFPLKELFEDKYWPPVGRIDNVAGDRNLVCTCPPMDAYAEAAE